MYTIIFCKKQEVTQCWVASKFFSEKGISALEILFVGNGNCIIGQNGLGNGFLSRLLNLGGLLNLSGSFFLYGFFGGGKILGSL